MSAPEYGNNQIVVKRRRTRRHRRNRLIRRGLFLAVLAIFTAGASISAIRYFRISFFASQNQSDSERVARSRERAALLDRILSQVQPARAVYPYSVVPGGIADAKELKWVAEHDPVVAAHYAGFDYDHARVVQVALDRSVYVSYRIGKHIYWMRRRIPLHKGEKLITDGKMTARGRCANRVEDKPQQEAATAEPAPEALDHPMKGDGGLAPPADVPFASSLLNRPLVGGPEPVNPVNPFTPLGGGGVVSLSPPPFPIGLCGPPTKKGTPAIAGGELTNGKKKPGPCGSGGPPPSAVPEPATWMLVASGFGAMLWQYRRSLAA